uniref:CCDC144C-like coiled-coil domain-containing protein n=1 Tax=Marmota marmota marmota TaxID=9994 RepID=A0A8C6EYK1_MARMA
MRLDIDTLKYQEEKEKKYLEDIEILREKHNALQSTVKLNEEIFIKTTLHYKEKIRLLKAELAMQNSNLENEEENIETLETEVSSCPVRLAAAPHHPDDSERAERDLGLVFQGARNEGFGSQAKEDFDTSSLTVGYELLPQQLSRSEMKIGSLENELHHTVDAFRKATFDLIQTQGQIEKMEHSDQDEKSQGNKYTKTQEWIEKRFSQPQREYTFPQQKLRDLRNQVENEEDILTNIQGRFHHMVNMFQAQTENHNLKEENRNMELINECDDIKRKI